MKPVRWRHVNPTHSELETAALQYMAMLGYHARRTHSGRYHPAHKGILDIVASKDGRVVWIEVKTGRDMLSEDQEKEIAELQNKGNTPLVIRSMDDLIKELDDLIGKV